MKASNFSKLFRLTIHINEDSLEYSPSTNERDRNSLFGKMRAFLTDVCSISNKLNKLTQKNPDKLTTYEGELCKAFCYQDHDNYTRFSDDISGDTEIQTMQNEIMCNVKRASVEAEKHLKSFMQYSFIWQDDKQLRLQYLLKKCREKPPEDEAEENKEPNSDTQTEVFQAEVFY